MLCPQLNYSSVLQRQAGNTGRHPGTTSFSKIGFNTHSPGGSPSHKRISNRNALVNNCSFFWLEVKYKNADLSALKSAEQQEEINSAGLDIYLQGFDAEFGFNFA